MDSFLKMYSMICVSVLCNCTGKNQAPPHFPTKDNAHCLRGESEEPMLTWNVGPSHLQRRMSPFHVCRIWRNESAKRQDRSVESRLLCPICQIPCMPELWCGGASAVQGWGNCILIERKVDTAKYQEDQANIPSSFRPLTSYIPMATSSSSRMALRATLCSQPCGGWIKKSSWHWISSSPDIINHIENGISWSGRSVSTGQGQRQDYSVSRKKSGTASHLCSVKNTFTAYHVAYKQWLLRKAMSRSIDESRRTSVQHVTPRTNLIATCDAMWKIPCLGI